MKQPIFLKPIFQERIWGGTKLRDQYDYQIPFENTGECWAISAHPNGQSVVRFGDFEGKTLGELWNSHRELFGNHQSDVFPLLTKILDANDDLSIQVHPNDEFAFQNENGELGKTECWYIIDCDEDAELIYGHNAQSKEELMEMVNEGKWPELLTRVKIKPGDFFYVPSGSIHALCKGTLVLETQQSSDTTYRVYDYDRRDTNGNLRELHIEKSIEVTTVPHVVERVEPAFTKTEQFSIITFVESDFFTVYKWEIYSMLEMSQNESFQLVSVLDGAGTIKTEEGSFDIRKGDHFILPFEMGTFQIAGELTCIVSHL
jgi:mannose-6-phosphate isomerase